jgi:hypothetical protein
MKINFNTKKYVVYVDDNFHYMDESERYCAGEYNSPNDAIAKCISIVENSLEESAKTVTSADELYKSYTMFGEDPFIVGPTKIEFSAWDYAKKRSADIYPIESKLRNEE